MLMTNRSPVSHAHRKTLLQLTLLLQREFSLLEGNNPSSHDCLPQERCYRQSLWFFFTSVVVQGGFMASLFMC